MEPFIGQIMLWAGTFEPRGWAFCDGRTLSVAEHTALFALIGSAYGGNGRTTFCLPDLRGRVAMGFGTGPGLTKRLLGAKSGVEANVLFESQMPLHTHDAVLMGSTETADINLVSNATLASGGRDNEYKVVNPNEKMHKDSVSVSETGGNAPINNMQPYVALNYVISLQGLYPSRND
ncbi:MAG: tail fiber protein [Bacteroidales bacterium]|nr:tail fiber protein [Bacteroidales bacterium]